MVLLNGPRIVADRTTKVQGGEWGPADSTQARDHRVLEALQGMDTSIP
jgi:hypothetical protein